MGCEHIFQTTLCDPNVYLNINESGISACFLHFLDLYMCADVGSAFLDHHIPIPFQNMRKIQHASSLAEAAGRLRERGDVDILDN